MNQDDLCFGCCPGLKGVKSILGIVQFTSRPAIVEDCDLIRSDEHHGNQETHGGGWSKSVFFSLKCVRLESVSRCHEEVPHTHGNSVQYIKGLLRP